MLTLQLLGGLALVTEDGKPIGRAAQKRRLALLAVLASRPGVPVTRDKLLALFWPEAPTDEARHRLSAALYDLRRALGDDALVARGDDVLLTPAAVRCDAIEFETAVESSNWRGAIELYRGAFLDGIHLDDAPEFDQWVDQRRTQLARAHGKALEEWARTCSERGDHGAAVDAWQRLTDTDPFNDRFALGLMKALESAGNRAGALRHAQEHEDRLRAELGVEPADVVRDFASSLLTSSGAPGITSGNGLRVPVTNPDPRIASHEPPAIGPAPVTAPAGHHQAPDIRLLSPAVSHESRWNSPRWWAVAAVAGFLLVTPFLLRNRDEVLSAEPAARSLGEAETHLLSGRFEAAVTAFEQAVTLDSTDARTHVRLALATLWADQPGDRIDARLSRALALRDRLDELDRALLDGLVAWRRGEWHTAEGLYRRALAAHPTSVAARHELGEVLFHYNAPQGRSLDEARIEFERVLDNEPNHYGALWHLALIAAHDGRAGDVSQLTDRLLALRPDAVRTIEVQALRASSAHDRSEIDRLLDRLRDVDESLLFSIGWRMAVFSRDLAGAHRVFSLLTAPTRGPYAEALGHMHLLYVDIARGRSSAAVQRLDALAGLRNAGMAVDWLAVVAAVAPDVDVPVRRLQSLRDSLADLTSNDAVLTQSGPERRTALLATLGSLHAILGDSAAALAVAARLEGTRQKASVNASRAATIRALHAWRSGRPDEVIHWTERSPRYRWFGDAVASPINAWSIERYLRAEALFSVGRLDEADRWFATLGDHDPSDLAFLPAALTRRAEIARALGDQVRARRLQAQRDELKSVLP